jgi:dynein heavy chain 1
MLLQKVGDHLNAGDWLLLENVHLATEWLDSILALAKKVEKSVLWMTCDKDTTLSEDILLNTFKICYEGPKGVHNTIERTLQLSDRSKEQINLSFIHSVLYERDRYVPQGWRSICNFSNSDLKLAFRYAAETGSQLNGYLSDVVYSGRLENDVDQTVLEATIKKMLRSDAFSKVPTSEVNEEVLYLPSNVTMTESQNNMQKIKSALKKLVYGASTFVDSSQSDKTWEREINSYLQIWKKV